MNYALNFKPYYDNQYPWQRISGYQATGTAIQNPFTFYYVNNNDWSSSHSYQFWNKNFTSDPGITNAATAKTIYSPSPSGFVEPKTAAFTNFTTTGGNTGTASQFNVSGAWYYSWNFYRSGNSGSAITFASFGLRDVYSSRSGTGAVFALAGQGNYWTVGASSTVIARRLYFNGGYIAPQSTDYRSCGFTVCSVKE